MISQQQTRSKILLIGDTCTDVYCYGRVDRLSPEAPVPVFVPESNISLPGMAGNVEANLLALECNVTSLFGVGTITKTRYIDKHSRQHIIRIDNDHVLSPIQVEDLPGLHQFDSVVISDYNKGSVSYELIERIRASYNGPIFVDTKKTDLDRMEGCILKINQLEYSRLTSQCSNLIVTLGADGVRYGNSVIPAPKIDVVDVCGAGDTFLAALACKYTATNNMIEAIMFAIQASSVTVQHMGVYAPTMKEILCD